MSAPHIFNLRVYIEDTDAGGIVYYANYLRFAERARSEAMRALGVPHARMISDYGRMFVVHRVNLVYHRPARLDDEIRVMTHILKVNGASLQLRQEFWRDRDSLAVLEVSLGCVSRDNGRPARIPAVFASGLKAGQHDDSPGNSGSGEKAPAGKTIEERVF